MSGRPIPPVAKVLDCPSPIPAAAQQPFTSFPTSAADAATVKVAALRAGTLRMKSPFFVHSEDVAEEMWDDIPDLCFVVERSDGERLVFDLGIRKDGDKTHAGPDHLKYYKAGGCSSTHGVGLALTNAGLPPSSIASVICSHSHFDHVGDLSEFPLSTRLVVGPNGPTGQALADEMDVPLEQVEGRPFRELSHEKDTWVDVGPFRGVDYWGDGSVFVLDLPGHKAAHVGLMCRTSISPAGTAIYHAFAADACHSDIFFQPKPPRIGVYPIPGTTTLTSLFDDIPTSYVSLAQLQRARQEDNVGVWTAHGQGLLKAFAGGLKDGEVKWLEGTEEELIRLKKLQV